MKFKELPEGYYYITDINHLSETVYVQRLEEPETMPRYVLEHDTIKVEPGGRDYNKKSNRFPKPLDDMEAEYKTFDEVKKERKSRSARISHITRRLNANEPLKGKTLELALDILGDGTSGNETLDGISKKLIAEQPLDECEHSLMVDTVLVHSRLGG